MAQNFYTFPLDVPAISRQGLRYREADAPGNAKWLTESPEAPQRTAKGDLGLSHIKDFEPRSLTHPGSFIKDMKGGK